MKIINNKSSIFYEKYKPQCIEDLILPDEIKKKLQHFVNTKNLPSIGLFSNTPGTGKSAASNAILTELGCEALWINASLENGIDTLRGKISKFASSGSLDGELKYIVYAIPGDKEKSCQPYGGRTGFVTWTTDKKNGKGYWLMFYDFKNSSIVIPTK